MTTSTGKGRRRGYGEGSITFDKDKGVWVGRLPRDERGRRPKVTGATAKEVQAKLRRRLQDREAGLPDADPRVTVQAFLEAWVRDTLPLSKRASRTVQSYEAAVRLHLVPALGRVPLVKLTPGRVQQFLRDELAAGKGQRTVELSHAVLRIALGQAEAWGRSLATSRSSSRVLGAGQPSTGRSASTSRSGS